MGTTGSDATRLHFFLSFTLLVQLLLCIDAFSSAVNKVENYCKRESFSAECDATQVIVVKYARFGRMRISRCVTKNYGNIPCSKDVLPLVDQFCSGKRLCEFPVSHPRLLQTQPCPPDLSEYLEAMYECQPVHVSRDEDCSLRASIMLDAQEGVISSLYATTKCPYVVEASAGQTITIGITDFSAESVNMSSSMASGYGGDAAVCQPLIVVEERLSDQATTICRSAERSKEVYTSETNSVRFWMKALHTAYLVQYKGCPLIQAPKGSSATIHENTMTIKCDNSKQTFTLICKNNIWIGPMDNCSSDTMKIHRPEEETGGMPSLGISVVIVFGVAAVIVIYVAVMIVCVMFIKRRRKTKDRTGALQSQHLDSRDDVMRYEKISASPREERVPMLMKRSTGAHEYNDTVTCQIHGTNAAPVECPYAALPRCCQCDICAANGRTTLPNCCITTHSVPVNMDRDNVPGLSPKIYESSRSLRGVRFATINAKGANKNRTPFFLEVNSRVSNTVNLNNVPQNSPDVLPQTSENEDNELKEEQLSSFKSL